MKAHLTAGALALVLTTVQAVAQSGPDCGRIAAALATIEGYRVSVPPAGPDTGWCVLDGASFRSGRPGWPDLEVDRLRLRQTATEVELDLRGLRATPRASDREVDDRIRSLLRLQAADLRLRAVHDPEAGVLTLTGLRLELSGGTVVELDGEMTGAGLSLSSLLTGAVTRAGLVWRSDGRLARPLMDMAGEGLAAAPGPAAVDAAQGALAALVAALPAAAVDDGSRKALAAAVAALPQGRGKLTLSFRSADGIGSARLAVVSLSGELSSPEALATLLGGATIGAVWQPGLAP
jgi:hypothetical protein